MPDESLQITIPDALVPAGGSPVLKLKIVTDKNGKRQITRQFRDANTSDPGRIRRVQYDVWGPIGNSFESSSGVLGIDLIRKLDTRWPSRMLPNGRENPVTLTGDDPPAATSGYFGGFTFGTNTFGTVIGPFTPTIDGGDVVVFDEQQGYLFAERGRVSTQIDMTTWTVVQSVVQPAVIRDSAFWRGNVYLAEGSTAPMQRRLGASAAGSSYEDTVSTSPVGNVYASAIKRGSDRAWYIDADEDDDSFNYAGFTLDRFVNLASPFQVGDPDIGTTGIGPFGPFTMFGAQDNIYSFTDQGKPVPFSRALLGFQSDHNGQQFADPGWGWNYVITAIGLRAMQPGADNPVGIGESMRGFTGHNGIPHAIWANRGELWVVYLDTNGDLYGYRGGFGPRTAATGQPAMFPWFYASSETCNAVFSSNTPPNPVIIRAAGTNMVYTVIAANGRDDLDPNYIYSAEGGTGWLTTLDRDPQLLKVVRLVRIRTRGMTYGATWVVACGMDTTPQDPVNSTYTTIGTVTTDGFHTLTPTNGGADSQGNPTPTAGIAGRTIKPRLTLTAKTVYYNYVLNPSFEEGSTTGWGAGSGFTHLISASAGGGITPFYDDYMMTFYSTVSSGSAATDIDLEPNTQYTVTAKFYIKTGYTGGVTTIAVADLAGVTGTVTATVNASLLDQWQTVTFGPFTTAAVVNGTLRIDWGAPSAASTIFVDGVMVVNADALTTPTVPYIDGNQGAGYLWLGTVNDSVSTWSDGNTVPPEVDAWELEYDERPEQITEVSVMVSLESLGASQDNYLWSTLRQLVGSTTEGPFRVQFPDDQPPGVTGGSGGGQTYAMLNSVTKREDISGEIEGVVLAFSVWPEAEALSR